MGLAGSGGKAGRQGLLGVLSGIRASEPPPSSKRPSPAPADLDDRHRWSGVDCGSGRGARRRRTEDVAELGLWGGLGGLNWEGWWGLG